MVALDSMFVCFLTYSFEVGGKSYVKNVSSSEKPKKLLLPGSLKKKNRMYRFHRKNIDVFGFDTKSGKLPPITLTISATYQLGVEMTYF